MTCFEIAWPTWLNDRLLFFFFLLFPNPWYQFHSNLITTHFARKTTRNKQVMILVKLEIGVSFSKPLILTYSNLIRTHFARKITLNEFSHYSRCLRRFRFLTSLFHDQCALRAVPVHSPQSLSTINISYWIALQRKITQTMNFQFSYAFPFVERFDN